MPPVFFQDFMAATPSNKDSEAAADVLSNRLFELANVGDLGFRCRGGAKVSVRQDHDAQVHTGGIVWETAFLLATYLEHQPGTLPSATAAGGRAKVLELGSGCGLLGLVLAHTGAEVVLSEHPLAVPNLRYNVAENLGVLESSSSGTARVVQLDWGEQKDVEAVRALGHAPSGTFDVIVGTDVIFAERWVTPLLRTMHQLSAADTTIWLCVQERCAAAHAKMLASLPEYFNDVAIISPGEAVAQELGVGVGNESGNWRALARALHTDLDCVMLRIRQPRLRGRPVSATAEANDQTEPQPTKKRKKKEQKGKKDKAGKKQKKEKRQKQQAQNR